MTGKSWYFTNGITVIQKPFADDISLFKVYRENCLLGTIYPADKVHEEEYIAEMNAGHDPVTEKFNTGDGEQCCRIDGWV